MPGDDELAAATKIEAAWRRVSDCGCRDIYYSPSSDEVECPRHNGFDVCRGRLGEHVPAR